MRGGLVDPAALMRLRTLEMRVRLVMDGFWRGLHRSPLHGFSVEFSEYRQYVPGDDPRFVDWRVYARTDRHFIKKHEDETNLRAYLLVDQSRSMSFGPGGVRKADYAAVLAGTLACFLSGQRDAVGVTTFHERVAEHLPARHRPGHLRRIYGVLEKGGEARGTDVRGMLERAPQLLRKRGLILVISDFLVPLEEMEPGLRALRVRGHELVLLQVLDPEEEEFAYGGPAVFRDMETGREVWVDGPEGREGYRRRWAEHREGMEGMAKRLGMDWVSMSTGRPVEMALWEFVARRRRREVTRVRKARRR